MVDEKTKPIKEYAINMLINTSARMCETVIDAKENGLTMKHIDIIKNHLKLMEKIVAVADQVIDNDMLHCILVSIPRKKTTPETDKEEDKEPTEDAPIQNEPYQKPEVLDEPPADQEEQKEQQQ